MEIKTLTIEEIQGYMTEEVVGEGASGKVYRGFDDKEEEVAIKWFFTKESVDQETLGATHKASQALSYFKTEVQVLAELNHSNILKPIATGDDGHQTAIVMKMFDTDMPRRLQGLTWYQTKKIIQDILNGLVHISDDHNYVLEDFKDSCIMIEDDEHYEPRAILIDFGSAKKGGGMMPLKTRGFTAPEIYFHGNGTKQSDIFSFGVVFLQLLTKQEDVGDLPDIRTSQRKGLKKTKEVAEDHITIRIENAKGKHDYHPVHPVFQNRLSKEKAELLINYGLKCAKMNTADRPATMTEVRDTINNML